MTLQEKQSRRLSKQTIRIETFISRPWLQRWGIPALVFVLALLPRSIHPVSRAMLWYSRSIRFSGAVLSGDLAATNIRHHPGVTVMWLSGFGLQLFARLRGLAPEHLLGLEPTPTGVIDEAVAAGVLPLALAIALCTASCYPLVRRLAGRRVALAAAVLLALAPFYISCSQVLHVDALLATCMLVSALFLLNHLHHGRQVDLVLSGVFGGLSLLTKSPALFLVPYTALAVGMHQMAARDHWRGGWRWWGRCLAVILGKVALWALVAAVTFVALWPAMWVEPLKVLSRMGRGISLKVGETHHNPIFFNGRILESGESPGPLFYLATVGWKTTLVTLPVLGVAILFAFVRLPSHRHRGSIVLLLAAYAVCFTAQMGLGARQARDTSCPRFSPWTWWRPSPWCGRATRRRRHLPGAECGGCQRGSREPCWSCRPA